MERPSADRVAARESASRAGLVPGARDARHGRGARRHCRAAGGRRTVPDHRVESRRRHLPRGTLPRRAGPHRNRQRFQHHARRRRRAAHARVLAAPRRALAQRARGGRGRLDRTEPLRCGARADRSKGERRVMVRKIPAVLLTGGAAFAVGGIALERHEPINALWIVTAAVCIYLLGYRFYAAWIAARVLCVDGSRATPAERLSNGRDFGPTHRWIAFGHHFAAIAGPGPLVGPTLAAQFGYLPGTLWILVGAVLGGCVQDMTILLLSTRRDGRSLGQMARDELGPLGGFAALTGTLAIMIILIAVLGLVIVNAMKHSPWGTSTVFATIPVAILVGIYLRFLRPGRVLEASLLGVALVLLAVFGGGWVDHREGIRDWFDYC